jgi:hypothetical protein
MVGRSATFDCIFIPETEQIYILSVRSIYSWIKKNIAFDIVYRIKLQIYYYSYSKCSGSLKNIAFYLFGCLVGFLDLLSSLQKNVLYPR